MEPIRLQHMITTFPYFQLLRLASLVTDLGLTAGSYLDAYDPRSGKWEQHTISTVRVVESQQRLLYRIRKNLFEGIPEAECPGLSEDVEAQSMPSKSPESSPDPPGADVPKKGILKRSAPESPTPAAKVHIPNNYYSTLPVSLPSPAVSVANSPATVSSPTQSFDTITSPSFSTCTSANPPLSRNDAFLHQQHAFYPAQSSDLPRSPVTTVPYHPHPPLKRWPNDYTVSELTVGFHAMETLIAQSPTGASLTQRAAFERVFGSRYVKSTVCRHRGVWKKAQGPLREQFEAMGTNERACWGEFVRRFEGRASTKNAHQGIQNVAQVPNQTQSGQGPLSYHARAGSGSHVISGSGVRMEDDFQAQVTTQREEEKSVDEGPIMDSLQKP